MRTPSRHAAEGSEGLQLPAPAARGLARPPVLRAPRRALPLSPSPASTQVRCTAEVSVRPDAAVKGSAAPSFDFGGYMAERAVLINAALDQSVPLQYPEVINESMR